MYRFEIGDKVIGINNNINMFVLDRYKDTSEGNMYLLGSDISKPFRRMIHENELESTIIIRELNFNDLFNET